MGTITRKEVIMALPAFATLVLWIFADKVINATMVALVFFGAIFLAALLGLGVAYLKWYLGVA